MTQLAASGLLPGLRRLLRPAKQRLLRALLRVPGLHVARMRRSWNRLHDDRGPGAISFLCGEGASWDDDEFQIVGARFVDRMLARFAEHGATDLGSRSVLEIGCGIGRFLRPLSGHCARVVGVDLSEKMLATARGRLSDRPNVELRRNNGRDLAEFADDSFDFCICAGVFQHVTLQSIILGYVAEGLRILRPGGLFLFQFMANRDETASDTVLRGARIGARDLSRALASQSYRIRELSQDPVDRNATLVVVLEKLSVGAPVAESERRFESHAIASKPWLSGIYDGIRSPVFDQHLDPGDPPARSTFLD